MLVDNLGNQYYCSRASIGGRPDNGADFLPGVPMKATLECDGVDPSATYANFVIRGRAGEGEYEFFLRDVPLK